MSLQLLFWILAILGFLGWIGGTWGGERFGWFAPFGNGLLFVLVLILGWAVFGAPIR